MFADSERVLVVTMSGELLLLDAKSERCSILSRLKLFAEGMDMYSHPALVGTRLFVRGAETVMCVDLLAN